MLQDVARLYRQFYPRDNTNDDLRYASTSDDTIRLMHFGVCDVCTPKSESINPIVSSATAGAVVWSVAPLIPNSAALFRSTLSKPIPTREINFNDFATQDFICDWLCTGDQDIKIYYHFSKLIFI